MLIENSNLPTKVQAMKDVSDQPEQSYI